MTPKRYWITNKQGSDWLDVDNRLVVDAAPRFRFALGWRIGQVQDYCDRRRWTLERRTEDGPQPTKHPPWSD